MNEIILIEDRPSRQAHFLEKEKINILIEKKFLTMPKEGNCQSLIEDINFNNTSSILKYSLIIIHKTSLHSSGLLTLSKLPKDLILFSGGESQIQYKKEQNQYLSLNSKDLYNNNLISFLEKYSNNKHTSLLELVYGLNWRLEFLMRYRLIKIKKEQEKDNYVVEKLEYEMKEIEKITEVSCKNIDSEIEKIILTL